ncbi:MAG: cysteine--tRNA ligase [Thermoproteota archaeon]|nr:cysteine--tRNA ligase [Thermoproteota archaeon]
MKLYNRLSNEFEEVKPNENNNIRIYLCGVTTYDDCHIGHARTILVFDVLRRYLRYNGFEVIFVQNFTDIDDKIINRAKKEGINAKEISSRYIESYFEDFTRLNVLRADNYPKATEHVQEMINLISELVKKNYAYLTSNGVYFRVKRFESYGKLSKKSIEELESGARIEIDALKEDPLDFALWKFSTDDPLWDSPWGKGRPGWHIECSAMALKYLGSRIEIHGGGQDLVFPHHENEMAQSESYTGELFSKFWIHIGMVTLKTEKMSKSLGNIITVKKAIKKWGPNTLRLYLLTTHYSKPLDYTDETLSEALQKWRQIEHCVYELRTTKKQGQTTEEFRITDQSMVDFKDALDANMNTSLAISSFLKLVYQVNKLSSLDMLTQQMCSIILPLVDIMLEILGLKVLEVDDGEKLKIEQLIEKRDRFRNAKQFLESDEIRRQLHDLYAVQLTDHSGYTTWKKIENISVQSSY